MNLIDWYQGLTIAARLGIFLAICVGLPAIVGIYLADRHAEAIRRRHANPTRATAGDEQFLSMGEVGDDAPPFRQNRIPRVHRALPLAADDPRGARPYPRPAATVEHRSTAGPGRTVTERVSVDSYRRAHGGVGEPVRSQPSQPVSGYSDLGSTLWPEHGTPTGRLNRSEPNRQFADDPEREMELSRSGRDIGPLVGGARVFACFADERREHSGTGVNGGTWGSVSTESSGGSDSRGDTDTAGCSTGSGAGDGDW
jgi:hypothetical protein